MKAQKDNPVEHIRKTPRRMELKDLLRRRDFPFTEGALLLSQLGFHSPFPPRRVNSLYFDSHDFRSLEHSISGTSIRQKTRLRWYGKVEDTRHPTLEFKCKQGHLSWKILQKTNLCIETKALDWASALREETSEPLSSSFQNLLPVNHHRPITIISYKRRYYESSDGRVRVTLDEDLSFRDQTPYRGPNFQHVRVHPEKLILEIKLAEEDSGVLRELARTLPFVPRRFSKYCEAMLGHLPRWI